MSFGLIYRIGQETIPGHLRHRHSILHERHTGIEHGGVIGRVGVVGVVEPIVVLVGHLRRSFMLKVGYQHCGSLKIKIALTACFYLLQRGRVHVHVNGGFGGSGLDRWLGGRPPLDLADEGDAAIFGVDGSIVSQQQVSSHKGGPALGAFEGSLFGICR